MSYNAISEYQRSQGPPGMNWAGVVYNALALEEWPYTPAKDDYLLAFGRICEAKGFHLAIEVARRTGSKLVMAGWSRTSTPTTSTSASSPGGRPPDRLRGRGHQERKRELFAHARGFLFPILWPEPFGLVMIEAMATGTPVIALRQGSVPEVVEQGAPASWSTGWTRW